MTGKTRVTVDGRAVGSIEVELFYGDRGGSDGHDGVRRKPSRSIRRSHAGDPEQRCDRGDDLRGPSDGSLRHARRAGHSDEPRAGRGGGAERALRAGVARGDDDGARRRVRPGDGDVPPTSGACELAHACRIARTTSRSPLSGSRRSRPSRTTSSSASARAVASRTSASAASTTSWPRRARRPSCRSSSRTSFRSSPGVEERLETGIVGARSRLRSWPSAADARRAVPDELLRRLRPLAGRRRARDRRRLRSAVSRTFASRRATSAPSTSTRSPRRSSSS